MCAQVQPPPPGPGAMPVHLPVLGALGGRAACGSCATSWEWRARRARGRWCGALLLPARAAYGLVHGALFHLLAFLALAAHARAMLTDPGSATLAPPGAAPRAAAARHPRARTTAWCARAACAGCTTTAPG